MTEVVLLGADDISIRAELLSRETSREALAAYDITQPYENSIHIETLSIGTAVALLNDINWHITRFVKQSLVRDTSIGKDEWLSRSLAEKVRAGEQDPDETGEYLMIYGVKEDSPVDQKRLVEPLYVRRSEEETPEYDLQDVDDTVIVRITEDEFTG
ncbi:hypothetical protein K0C01_06975 [Salinarchaeum sp. IM2453]|uniref:DUF5804 family protein n=1 Tax=Salinarchaeum sp. IM2453 TaxID=2862870 RepID=UPI001C82E2AE|nr:DUF5804 family protein [Salinarchaeum sp. IM2453]QZA87560.1 hypothetical protein K0C01_06975 [Salinarchaeum sp. IM2453]